MSNLDFSGMTDAELADIARGNASIIAPSALERAEIRAFLLEVAERLEAKARRQRLR